MSDSENTENQGGAESYDKLSKDKLIALLQERDAALAAQPTLQSPSPSPATVQTAEGIPSDAQPSTLAQIAAAGRDPSDTYTHGAIGGNVNSAVPAGAHVVTTLEEAQEAGYYGYAPGSAVGSKMTVAAKAKTVPTVQGASLSEGDKKPQEEAAKS